VKKSTKDRAKGKFYEVEGKVRETVGRVANKPNLKAEGRGEQMGGKILKKISKVERALGL
jgi:uncharacterized protein YjbJ (UPF0337 family)